MKRHRLRLGLALANTLTMLLLLGLFGVGFRAAVHAVLWRQLDLGISRQVDAVQRVYGAILVDPAHAAERRAAAERTVSALDTQLRKLPGATTRGSGPPRAWPIRVLDRNGRAFLRAYARIQGVDEPWDRPTFERSLNGATIRLDKDGQRILSQPLRVRSQIVGVIQGAQPTAEAEAVLQDLDRLAATAFPLAAFLSAIAGWLLAALGLRPVQALSQRLRRLDVEGEERLPARDDELAPIAEAFDQVLVRLRRTVQGVRDRAERQQTFTDEVSHELRTPLTVVKANAGFLLAQEGLSPADRDALEAILVAANSMTRLVDDLLAVARAEGAALHPEPVDVLELVRSLDWEGIAVTFEIAPKLIVFADREHLLRVFRNLLANARHHGQAATVRIAGRIESGEAILEFEDLGQGMAPEVLERLGERFFRGPSDAKGTGLGISIVRSLVEAHGGHVAFWSAPGEGTRVTLRLSRVPQETALGKP